ncbi:SDR family oxidoreductase [Sinomonas terrae]|nr:SDR family oxidoreductase [Sinomonas terrae]
MLWVTGGGSGMGRAAAVAAAASGWKVAVSGRRPDAVAAAADDVRQQGAEALEVPVDVRDAGALREAHDRISGAWGPVNGLVVSAGLNAPRRSWSDQSMDEFADIVDTGVGEQAREKWR